MKRLLSLTAVFLALVVAASAQIGPIVGLGPLPILQAASAALQRSLIYTAASSQYLQRTLGAPTDAKKWTFATWIKRASIGGVGMDLFSPNAGGAAAWNFVIGGSTWTGAPADAIGVMTNGMATNVSCTNTITDTTTWHHIMVAVDTTQGTAANRVHLYQDGAECTYSGTSYPGLNTTWLLNTAVEHHIGTYVDHALYFLNAKLASTYFVDGQQLTPSSFVTGSGSGTTHPATYTGTFGNNGFWLSYCNNTSTTTLGYDDDSGAQCSGAGSNDWTLTNMTTANSSTDVPQ